MAQHVDFLFGEYAETTPLNHRFLDITGSTVLGGFRLHKGSDDFTINLIRGGYDQSIAITPSGAKIIEDEDLYDVVGVQPNQLNEGNPRVDSVYLIYQHGRKDATASYAVIPGTGGSDEPAPNPNPKTHLLLGYVDVPPMGAVLKQEHLRSVETGFAHLEVANYSIFKGGATFKDEVVFEQNVRFMGDTIGNEDPNSSFVEKLTYPIEAEPGQQEFTLPTPYTPKRNTLFIYKDGVLQEPHLYNENSPTTFRFHDPLDGGESIWFYWFRNISFYQHTDHDHDEYYYRKNEVNSRLFHYYQDYFGGEGGRTIKHFLGIDPEDYVVMMPVPLQKNADVGTITVEKTSTEIIVYNEGTYRGLFDLTYYVKQGHQYTPNDEDMGMVDVEATNRDDDTYTYQKVNYKRPRDGTLYLQTVLTHKDARGYYRRMRFDFYNSQGTNVIQTVTYALDYDDQGLIYYKTRITSGPPVA